MTFALASCFRISMAKIGTSLVLSSRYFIFLLLLYSMTITSSFADSRRSNRKSYNYTSHFLFRMVRVVDGYTYHFYTISCDEAWRMRDAGYALENWTATPPYLWLSAEPGTTALERLQLLSAPRGQVLATAYFFSADERENRYMRQKSWSNSTVVGRLFLQSLSQLVPIYRSFNPGDADWFYTTSSDEHERSKGAGWYGNVDGIVNPGIIGYAATSGRQCILTDRRGPPI